MFIAECQKWINEFGRFGWRFYFQHEEMEGAIARCCFPDKPEDRVFTICLNTKLPKHLLTNEDILRSAFHEVMEAFLWRLSYLGECRCLQPEEIPEEIHHLIRTLEVVIFDRKVK
jgi:hypothetical protein